MGLVTLGLGYGCLVLDLGVMGLWVRLLQGFEVRVRGSRIGVMGFGDGVRGLGVRPMLTGPGKPVWVWPCGIRSSGLNTACWWSSGLRTEPPLRRRRSYSYTGLIVDTSTVCPFIDPYCLPDNLYTWIQ